MKVLIWVLTFFIGSILNTLIGYAIGIRAGAVLLYIAEYFIAKNLCKKWDEHKIAKEYSAAVRSSQIEKPAEVIPVKQNTSPESQEAPVQKETANNMPILFCRHCGFKLVEGSAFCSKCGRNVERE